MAKPTTKGRIITMEKKWIKKLLWFTVIPLVRNGPTGKVSARGPRLLIDRLCGLGVSICVKNGILLNQSMSMILTLKVWIDLLLT